MRVLLRELAPFVIADEVVSSWPGTVSAEANAHLARFRVTADSMRLSRDRADALQDWLHPALPEDLCAWRDDGELVLGSTAREREGWLDIEPEEFDAPSEFVELLPDPS